MVGMYIIIPIVTFIIGGLLAWLGMRFLLKSKYDSVLQEAEKEAEVSSDDESSVEKDDSNQQNTVTESYDNDHKITVSTPAGASVYLDGNYQGVAPCSFPKKIGAITLTLAKDGYTTKSYSVTTTDDDEDVSWSFPDLTAKGSETN